MTKTLIGFTGFVGSSLLIQTKFNKVYNSKNIDNINNCEHDIIVCAGSPGIKWLANKNPKDDLYTINNLISNLKKTSCNKIILISYS